MTGMAAGQDRRLHTLRDIARRHGQPLTADYLFSFFKSPHAKAFIVTP